MFSIVCVYNNEQALKRILVPSLLEQTAAHEFIPVNNTKGDIWSAAEGLNRGARLATGKYIMFVHQDVELGSKTWLADAEQALEALSDVGTAGAVGMSAEGSNWDEGIRGHMSNCGEIVGKPLMQPVEVNTLDECLLIVPRTLFEKYQFDSLTFDGWHCYGADYCLRVQELGLKTYVLPGFIYHRSLAANVKNILEYQRRMYRKHSRYFPKIYTTSGNLTARGVMGYPILEILLRIYKRTSWIRKVEKEFKCCQDVVDLGCGYNSPLQRCKVPYSVGVDLFEPYLQESSKKAIHNRYVKADLRVVDFPRHSFDGVFCSEVLEHMLKGDGYTLIRRMNKWARKVIVVTTPNGYVYQGRSDDNTLQEHKAGWGVAELRRAGFVVHGMNGWKFLRGPKGKVKYRPVFFWESVSGVTQQMVYYLPWLAFQLLAVKRVK